jgi:phosphatidylserine decarboxylase
VEALWIPITIVASLIIIFVWFKYLYFVRDPERRIPDGNNIVSPADGIVVYVREIEVEEITKVPGLQFDGGKLIGIHMSIFNVHINRAPISGRIEKLFYYKGKNLSMIKMGLRTLLRLKPYYKDSEHIIQNERETSIIRSENGFSICLIRIADRIVKKIVGLKEQGDLVVKGERIGLIKMGSQVDIILPPDVQVLVKEGDRVVAGETVIASS